MSPIEPPARRQPDFAAIRAEFQLPGAFPPEVLAEAEQAASSDPGAQAGREDATGIELVTIDPPGAKDLDQALGVQRTATGYRVHYAIADLGVAVRPGGALDAEVRRRGQTIYLPDGAVPLHPPVLSEGAASLLPDGPRPAVLWRFELDSDAEPVAVELRRAMVRSRAQLDYDGVQAAVDAGRLPDALAALPEVGRLRRSAALRRGAIELELPEQEVRVDGDGAWTVAVRRRLEVEAWNAEISLLTGMCAAQLMLTAGVGVLRTLPAADPRAVSELRGTADRLGVRWPAGATVAEVLAGVDRRTPEGMALLRAASRLLRGAGYEAFDGAPPARTEHAGIGAPYAHVTAPLRRLVDRFATEVCLAVSAGGEVPGWVRAALPTLTRTMAVSDALAASVHRSCVDRTEAAVLAPRVGERFDVVVLRGSSDWSDGSTQDDRQRDNRQRDDRQRPAGEVYLPEPPALAPCTGQLTAGDRAQVRLVDADPATGRVHFDAN